MASESAPQTEVIVVGAGPAGCAAALELARLGRRVLVLERASLPQSKVCGDVLSEAALALLDGLGLGAALRAEGQAHPGMQLFAPGGRALTLPIQLLSLSRQRLHALLQEQLAAAGVGLLQAEVLGPLHVDGLPGGVRARRDGEMVTFPANLVLLASGARYATLEQFGAGLQAAPSAVAVRGYFRDLDAVGCELPQVGCHPRLTPGFGWVIPLPGRIYNIGCLHFLRGERPEQFDLPRLLDGFIASFPPAAALAADELRLGLPAAGLLRCGLGAARTHSDGLLVVGEAAGTGLPLCGEGVASALESGLLAARTADAALQARDTSGAFLSRYQRQLEERFAHSFAELAAAERWLSSPWRLDTLAWQAQRQPGLRTLLADVFNRRVAASAAFSYGGLLGWAGRKRRAG